MLERLNTRGLVALAFLLGLGVMYCYGLIEAVMAEADVREAEREEIVKYAEGAAADVRKGVDDAEAAGAGALRRSAKKAPGKTQD